MNEARKTNFHFVLGDVRNSDGDDFCDMVEETLGSECVCNSARKRKGTLVIDSPEVGKRVVFTLFVHDEESR